MNNKNIVEFTREASPSNGEELSGLGGGDIAVPYTESTVLRGWTSNSGCSLEELAIAHLA